MRIDARKCEKLLKIKKNMYGGCAGNIYFLQKYVNNNLI